MNFARLFKTATECDPFPYQSRLAEADQWPDLLEAPTGAGKTAAIVLAWLWRRRFATKQVRDQTPRRLVYCLPMRVLVEQTHQCVIGWLDNLELRDNVGAHVLMGGEQAVDWDLYPERECVLIGTQDMLLSRALNRGYALSRYRWPMPFGLLNNDCLWVFDEVQLMGSGLATTAQLAAFRESLGAVGINQHLWASATVRQDWLITVDFAEQVAGLKVMGLSKAEWRSGDLSARLKAAKALDKTKAIADDPAALAEEILNRHKEATSPLTLVVVNTVKKAVKLYEELTTAMQAGGSKRGQKKPATLELIPALDPELLLLHSRFRPAERKKQMEQLKRKPFAGGRIVISTQVIEAGVDISAQLLFTELAPWPSLVQRFGRCNRKGEFKKGEAGVWWIEVDTAKKGKAAPYTPEELDEARKELKSKSLKDAGVGPLALREHFEELDEHEREKRLVELFPYAPEHVLRRKDLLDLFDTTPDLSGNDVDVSRFIREGDDLDVQVYWREIAEGVPTADMPAPWRGELCAVPVNDFRDDFVKRKKQAYRWDPLAKKWDKVSAEEIFPGQVYLIPHTEGGYDPSYGWRPESHEAVTPVLPPEKETCPQSDETPDGDRPTYTTGGWQTVAEHTDAVVKMVEEILEDLAVLLTPEERATLQLTARWHDRGKAHEVFQARLAGPATPALEPWAKSPQQKDDKQKAGQQTAEGKRKMETRTGFRHELASALAMLQAGLPDLACYLAAAHHGKVRFSIRSMPNEKHPPEPDRRFARGVWDDEVLPATHMGNGVTAPEVQLSLLPMELGLSVDGQPSWAERILALRDALGPFRLAYLEAVLCAADRRASAAQKQEGAK